MNQNSAQSIFNAFGQSRLSHLLTQANDIESALRAYQWEMELGQALLKPIGVVEVMLRNALDQSIQTWWSNHEYPGIWTDCSQEKIPEPLRQFAHINDWRRRATRNLSGAHRLVTHDDIIAHTCFGTWKNMIGNPSAIHKKQNQDLAHHQSRQASFNQDARCALLWKEMTGQAFVNIPQTKRERQGLSPRGYIGLRLARISSLRNRVCHWDNLTKVDARERYRNCLEIVDAICPPCVPWLDAQCSDTIEALMETRPQWMHRINMDS